jgi:hypothetical protein
VAKKRTPDSLLEQILFPSIPKMTRSQCPLEKTRVTGSSFAPKFLDLILPLLFPISISASPGGKESIVPFSLTEKECLAACHRKIPRL